MSETGSAVRTVPSGARGSGRFTVQTWFQLVLAVMAIVVLIGAAAGAQVIAETNTATDRLLEHTQPASREAAQLQNALINQETGVRGYALTGDRKFLEPDTLGREQQARAAARIAALIADDPDLLTDLDFVQRAAAKWRADYARTETASPASPASPAALAANSVQGKALFDEIRKAFDDQSAGFTAAIAEDRRTLDQARALRNTVLTLMVAVLLLTGLVLTVLVRRFVARPLSALTTASLRVADGDFDHRIDVTGPADITTVAAATESMRRRVVSELEISRAQEAVLAGQKAELDVQTEDLRRSNTELEQFAYVASHDLQEPLRKVASFCQLLEKRYGDQLDARGKQYIDYAVDGAKRMQVLINDLLTFSRVGRLTDSAARIGLGATLDVALSNISPVIEDTGARLELPARLPEVVGDPTLLTMLWQNLIANAVKFRAPDRAPLVRIDAELEADTGMWGFAVTDNGIGIEPDFAEKVLVIFQRLHNREEYGGTGIGLAVCRKIVEYHGGKIWVDTDYTDGGTRFRFTLPAPASLVEGSTVLTADDGGREVPR
ncbi:CHASE3 domain-containing protein [Nocardia sp. NBC_01377]|uniref:sensor histidine kinase n=1 Tax=Nocardia sp. NBC_01377 TaxID=2903595 RepID=UPI003251DEA5